MRRMFSMAPVKERALRTMEAALVEDLLSNVTRNSRNDTNARMADIINKMKRDEMEDVLQSLAEVRPKDAELLKGMLFTFDDIVKLPARSRMVLFDAVPTERIVLALKGTDNAFRELILSSLASRARRIVEGELGGGSPATQRDVAKARRAIADVALEMAERGQIELSAPEGEEDAEIY
jgi:flagellar motor switch protein FliG